MTVVYTKPNCIQCEQTKKMLDRNGTVYTTIDITQDQEAYNKVVGMGFMSAPVVISGSKSWSGFQPELINSLA